MTLGGVQAWTDSNGDGIVVAVVNGQGLGVTAWSDPDLDGVAAATIGQLNITYTNGPALLAGTTYDATSAQVQKSTASLLAMTAFDTTNLRLTFTAPANGIVLVHSRGVVTGANTSPAVLWGVLDGATVRCRQAPIQGRTSAASGSALTQSCSMLVTGLTPSQSYTWDLAYGVEALFAGTSIRYAGLNDTTANNAYGGISFEIWSTPNLLAGKLYDPASASTTNSTGTVAVMTALDTTNLRLTFTAPTGGIVRVRLRGCVSGTTGGTQSLMWGILDGATIRFRGRGLGGANQIATSPAATDQFVTEAIGLVSGLTPGNSYTWDAAYDVEAAQASGSVKYGGPDNASGDAAWGGFSFDVWSVT